MHGHMMGHMDYHSYLSAIIVGSIRIIGSILSAVCLAKKCSRKRMMICSALGMFVAMTSLALIEHFKHDIIEDKTVTNVLLLVSSCSFLFFQAIGFAVIPMMMIGELCPIKLKSLTSGITLAFVSILVFTVVKVFPIAMAAFGAPITYGFFALVCFLGFISSFIIVPETRGKSVDELQSIYK